METQSQRGNGSAALRLRRLDIDTYREFVVFMNRDCEVCRSEGFEVRSRISVRMNGRHIVATLNTVGDDLLSVHEVSLSEAAWKALGAQIGQSVELSHPVPLASDSYLRKKVYGGGLEPSEIDLIIREVTDGRYDDIHLAAFVTACAGDRLDAAETVSLTAAMTGAGQRLSWPAEKVADKHCIGGLPGNRTSMIVVPIIAAAGLVIPKTSSRAITSPAGTADVMETLTRVDLDIAAMRRVVEREGGCIVWGGAMQLSPADDILISVERPLDFDSEGQLVASVLSKKIAAGSTHVVLDIPVGPTAKLRTMEAASRLEARFRHVASAFGLELRIVQTDGSQPVGRGIGPSLEARDVLEVLQNRSGASAQLASRGVALSARLLELMGACPEGAGIARARSLLATGAAWRKFQAICEAQGGMREPKVADHRAEILAERPGRVTAIDNRRLAKVAKLAGAPHDPLAGVDFHAALGTPVERGQPLYTVHAQTRGELGYALSFARAHGDIIGITQT
ncbi:thymidine phosphorylase family protein [Aestuariivirga sp.]|uniref:thymidine phosphorylase family protein n=1 Tax=Aestuariivirga sp. TaxID=2650926 RepID=UPI00391BB4B8